MSWPDKHTVYQCCPTGGPWTECIPKELIYGSLDRSWATFSPHHRDCFCRGLQAPSPSTNFSFLLHPWEVVWLWVLRNSGFGGPGFPAKQARGRGQCSTVADPHDPHPSRSVSCTGAPCGVQPQPSITLKLGSTAASHDKLGHMLEREEMCVHALTRQRRNPHPSHILAGWYKQYTVRQKGDNLTLVCTLFLAGTIRLI